MCRHEVASRNGMMHPSPRLSSRLSLALLGVLLPLVPTSPARAQAAECIDHLGVTVCGYHCIDTVLEARCAKTPRGVCHANLGHVTCWDPEVTPPRPDETVARRVRPTKRPHATCVEHLGKTVCGYHCVDGTLEARCARTPWGACHENLGHVTCWDPDLSRLRASGIAPVRAECVEHLSETVCGYHCVDAVLEARCAHTPAGTCRENLGHVACWDP